MGHLFQKKDHHIELLNDRSSSLDIRIDALKREIKRDEKLLDAYTHPSWETVISEILESELNHIARVAIKVDSSAIEQRYMQQGAYDKVEELFRRKDVLQADIDGQRAKLLKLMEERAEVLSKLEKQEK